MADRRWKMGTVPGAAVVATVLSAGGRSVPAGPADRTLVLFDTERVPESRYYLSLHVPYPDAAGKIEEIWRLVPNGTPITIRP